MDKRTTKKNRNGCCVRSWQTLRGRAPVSASRDRKQSLVGVCRRTMRLVVRAPSRIHSIALCKIASLRASRSSTRTSSTPCNAAPARKRSNGLPECVRHASATRASTHAGLSRLLHARTPPPPPPLRALTTQPAPFYFESVLTCHTWSSLNTARLHTDFVPGRVFKVWRARRRARLVRDSSTVTCRYLLHTGSASTCASEMYACYK